MAEYMVQITHTKDTDSFDTDYVFTQIYSINFAFYAKYMDVVFVTINMIINYIPQSHFL